MMRFIPIGLTALAVVAAPATAQTPRAEISAAMAASAQGWNSGSLDAFMAIYANDATFVGRSGLVNTKAAIADRYRPSFAAGGNMRGKLSFQPLAFRTLSNVHQLLYARWTLTPADTLATPETGITTLIFERRADGWKIISDHSS